MTHKFLFCFSLLIVFSLDVSGRDQPVRVGIAGLTHGHVVGILDRKDQGDIKIVGIAESNRALAEKFSRQYGFPMKIVYNSIDEMIAATQPEAVCAFGSIYEHMAVVEACAPEGIDVMVEKPLAVNMEHAERMKALAKKYNIKLITNYETTWYPTNRTAYEMVKEGAIGDMRKVIIRDGHRGPKKIGVGQEFLDWLTDPVQNGGGAITDFGCYGLNLVTWLTGGKLPKSVTAVTAQFQPENNPRVDDDATIILTYDKMNAIIEPSWDWPMGRKDMEIYGLTGAIYADNRNDLRVRMAEGYDGFKEQTYRLEERPSPYNDPFAFFAAVVRNKISPSPYDPSALENNMMVVRLLDAARKSAKTNHTIDLK